MVVWPLLVFLVFAGPIAGNPLESPLRQCEPIRIDMCRGIGYNETSMPNLVGHELQTEVELTLQTFTPLIEYVGGRRLSFFLCAAYVPMCTSKVSAPIGPCRSLCESVRSRCHPVLQGFGFPWPPALDCNRFPKENNLEAMCMEGPAEPQSAVKETDMFFGMNQPQHPHPGLSPLECPGYAKSDLYVKLYRSGRCAPLCESDILFGKHEKHLAEVWVSTWTYASLGLVTIATMYILFSESSMNAVKWSVVLTPLLWCHNMTALGWTVRFISGRNIAACGYDPQLPNVSLLLVDGLSNASCAATFLLRYYFGMAANAWWAILCLGWNRHIRRNSPDSINQHLSTDSTYNLSHSQHQGRAVSSRRLKYDVIQSNLARFVAWALPGFQTAAVIVVRLVDADELLGACYVGNQSDSGLQILVATPLFCYWIFGTMNLISGYLVHRRSKEILQKANVPCLRHPPNNKRTINGMGTFLLLYCIPCTFLLLAVIYEFANIDIWLNIPPYLVRSESYQTPLWPFLMRAFMELMLGIICAAWILAPKISKVWKQQSKQKPASTAQQKADNRSNFGTVSYQTVQNKSSYSQGSIITLPTSRTAPSASNTINKKKLSANMNANPQFIRYGNETVL